MTGSTPRLALITAPTPDVFSVADLKTHLRVDHADDDDLIEAIRDAIVDQIDAAGGGWLGRALRPQTWETRLCGFPSCEIELPYPPFSAIDSFKYDDSAGVETTLAAVTGYRVLGFTTGDKPPKHKVRLVPPYNTSWPTARSDYESVRIRFTCGYPVAAEASGQTPAVVDDLPPLIVAWIKMNAGTLYAQRETLVVGQTVAALPDHILNMLSTLRAY